MSAWPNGMHKCPSGAGFSSHFILSFRTPCTSMIWHTALEKPHMGASGVPFMKITSGSFRTAASILKRASCDRSRTNSRFDCGGLDRRKALLPLLLRREWRCEEKEQG